MKATDLIIPKGTFNNNQGKVKQFMAVKVWQNLLEVLAFPQHPEPQEFQSNPTEKQKTNMSSTK